MRTNTQIPIRLKWLLLLLAVAGSFSSLAQQTQTYIVTKTLDSSAGGCQAGDCSLRAAIDAANADGVPSIIKFNFATGTAPYTIFVRGTPLPLLFDQETIIDGLLDNSYEMGDVIIDGSLLGTGTPAGLTILGHNTEIYGLQIQNFGGNAIEASTAAGGGGISVKIGEVDKGNILILNGGHGLFVPLQLDVEFDGNYVGADPDFTPGLGNSGRGIDFTSSTTFNPPFISITNSVIADNSAGGIVLRGNLGFDISDNLIGTDDALSANLSNIGVAVTVQDNVIGGGTIARNAIAYSRFGININASIQTTITENSMFCNLSSAINRSGNDLLINITSANTTTVTGTSNAAGGTVEVFLQDLTGCFPGTACQGKTFLGNATVAGGTWSLDVSGQVSVGDVVTATVTEASGTFPNTSPFSNCQTISCPVITVDFDVTPTCVAQDNGSLTANPSGGAGPYQFNWSNGGTTATISNLPTGTYSVTILDAAGCRAVGSATVGEILGPTANAGADQVICEGASATLNGSATGGTGPYSFLWVPGGNGATITVTPTATTTYELRVSDSQGCVDRDQMIVNVVPGPEQPNAGPDQTLCANEPADLEGTIGPGPAAAVVWRASVAGGTFSPNANTLNATYTPPAGATTVTLTLSTTNGTPECPDLSDQMTITYLAPVVANAGPDQTICEGESVTLNGSATGGAGPYTFSWDPGGDGASITVSPTANTVYDLLVTDSQGCTGTDRVLVQVTTGPEQPDAGPDQTLCADEPANLQGSIGADPTAAGIWTASVAGGTFTPDATALNATYTPPAGATTVTLTLSTTTGTATCPDLSDELTITYLDGPTADAGGDQQICEGNPVTLNASATGGTGPYSFSWTPGGDGASITVTPAVTTVYDLLVTDAQGCTDDAQVTVQVNVSPEQPDAGPDQSLCTDEPANLQGRIGADPTAPGIWTASVAGGNFAPDATTLNATYTPPAGATTVTLTLSTTNGTIDCPDLSDEMTITYSAGPTADAGPDQTLCAGTPATLAGSVGGTGASGGWSASVAGGSFSPDEFALDAVYTPPVGIPMVTLTLSAVDASGLGLCPDAQDEMTITFTSSSDSADAGPDQEICSGETVQLAGSFSGGATDVQWTTDGDGTFSDPAALDAVYTPGPDDINAQGATLTLTTSGNASCLPASDEMSFRIRTAPTYTVSGTDPSACGDPDGNFAIGGLNPGEAYDGSYTIAGAVVNISQDASAAGEIVVDNLGPGIYSDILLTDGFGCSGPTLSVELSSPDGPQLSVDSSPICQGGIGNAFGNASGGTAPYTHQWIDQGSGSAGNYQLSDENTESLVINAAGAQAGTVDLLYQVTDSGGCIASVAVTVIISKLPEISNVMADSASSASTPDGNLQFTLSGGTAPYAYSWSGPVSGSATLAAPGNASILNLLTGLYSLSVTDDNGCSTSLRFRIGVNEGSAVCTSESGTMEMTNGIVQSCQSSPIALAHNGDDVLDADDVLVFALREMNGNIVKINPEPVFSFTPDNMTLNTVYQASALVGNGNAASGNGIDLSDPCLDESNAVELVFRENLSGVLNFIQGEEELCQGEELILSTNNLGVIEYFWITPGRDTIRTIEPMVMLTNIQPEDAGSYYVIARDGDCLNDQTGPFNLIVNGLPVGNPICAGDDQTVCEGSVQLQACDPGPGIGTWTSLSGASISNPTSAGTAAINLSPGENLFVWTVAIPGCGEVGSDTVRVLYESVLFAQPDAFTLERANTEIFMDVLKNDNIADGADYELTAISEPSFGILETLEHGFRFYETESRRGMVEFVYQVCYLGGTCMGTCDTARVQIDVLNLPYVAEGITPDGDGRNDELTILGYTPGDSELRLEMTIANQWGEIIYHSNDYTNVQPWDGTFKGAPVPQGAYYCHLKTIVPEGEFERQQTIYVVR